MIVTVAREQAIRSAIPSKIYVDGAFFCYGLENDSYKIPTGIYSAYGQTSPKFGTNKVYLNVPNRTNILFHGGNSSEQTKGCILTGRERNGEYISGDCSDELFNAVDNAYKNGESIDVKITSSFQFDSRLIIAGLAVLALFYAIKG